MLSVAEPGNIRSIAFPPDTLGKMFEELGLNKDYGSLAQLWCINFVKTEMATWVFVRQILHSVSSPQQPGKKVEKDIPWLNAVNGFIIFL